MNGYKTGRAAIACLGLVLSSLAISAATFTNGNFSDGLVGWDAFGDISVSKAFGNGHSAVLFTGPDSLSYTDWLKVAADSPIPGVTGRFGDEDHPYYVPIFNGTLLSQSFTTTRPMRAFFDYSIFSSLDGSAHTGFHDPNHAWAFFAVYQPSTGFYQGAADHLILGSDLPSGNSEFPFMAHGQGWEIRMDNPGEWVVAIATLGSTPDQRHALAVHGVKVSVPDEGSTAGLLLGTAVLFAAGRFWFLRCDRNPTTACG